MINYNKNLTIKVWLPVVYSAVTTSNGGGKSAVLTEISTGKTHISMYQISGWQEADDACNAAGIVLNEHTPHTMNSCRAVTLTLALTLTLTPILVIFVILAW